MVARLRNVNSDMHMNVALESMFSSTSPAVCLSALDTQFSPGQLRGALFLLLKFAFFCTASSVHRLNIPVVHDDLSVLVVLYLSLIRNLSAMRQKMPRGSGVKNYRSVKDKGKDRLR